MPQVITGKMVELLRANKLQDAVQKLQEMVKTNQFMNLKQNAKLADSIGMRRLEHFVRPSCIPFFVSLGSYGSSAGKRTSHNFSFFQTLLVVCCV
jgi:hypothetical protein